MSGTSAHQALAWRMIGGAHGPAVLNQDSQPIQSPEGQAAVLRSPRHASNAGGHQAKSCG
ncbi:hypothetical protein P4S72_00600 [Vibrio sp. PP-XX7]